MTFRSLSFGLLLGLAGWGPAIAEAELTNVLAGTNGWSAGSWEARWERHILKESRNRYCDREMGEEIGWLISPFLNGFYYGYRATRDPKWVDMLVDWTDSWVRRGVTEPDGYVGWPKTGTGDIYSKNLYTDSLLGEAMGLRPVVLMAGEILKTPALKERYGRQAASYLRLAEQTFEKWDSRGAWREVKDGGLWVVPLFGLDTNAEWRMASPILPTRKAPSLAG